MLTTVSVKYTLAGQTPCYYCDASIDEYALLTSSADRTPNRSGALTPEGSEYFAPWGVGHKAGSVTGIIG